MQDAIQELLRGAPAPNTERAYAADVRYFWAWARVACVMAESYPVDPDVVRLFVEQHVVGLPDKIDLALVAAGVKRKPGLLRVGTVRRRVYAVITEHTSRGMENNLWSPHISAVFRAAKRKETQRGEVRRQARAITAVTLDAMLRSFGSRQTTKDRRDMAMLVFAFYTGGRRRSEVADARAEFLTRWRSGYRYVLFRSKTDQTGQGSEKLLRWPHARYLEAWLDASGVTDGYLFRHVDAADQVTALPMGPQALSRVIKERVEAIGLNPKYYSGHSLRRGFLTECGRSGITLSEAMQCSGHKNVATALQYYEEGLIEENKATKVNQKAKKAAGRLAAKPHRPRKPKNDN